MKIRVAGAVVVFLWAISHAHSQPSGGVPEISSHDDAGQFAAVILAATEDAWHRILGEGGQKYVEPTLVLYTSATGTACGVATSGSGGNFYCPSDQKIYFDSDSVGGYAAQGDPLGDYLTVWLIVRGVSEHVQNLRGEIVLEGDPRRGSLQADCYVGIWSKSPESLFSADDFAALNLALLRFAEADSRSETGAATFGTPDERVHWLGVGHASGRVEDCRIE
jgi:hypothetical protein